MRTKKHSLSPLLTVPGGVSRAAVHSVPLRESHGLHVAHVLHVHQGGDPAHLGLLMALEPGRERDVVGVVEVLDGLPEILVVLPVDKVPKRRTGVAN